MHTFWYQKSELILCSWLNFSLKKYHVLGKCPDFNPMKNFDWEKVRTLSEFLMLEIGSFSHTSMATYPLT